MGLVFSRIIELKLARHGQLGDQMDGRQLLEGSKNVRRSWGQEDGRQPQWQADYLEIKAIAVHHCLA
jgi:hypothetical protein